MRTAPGRIGVLTLDTLVRLGRGPGGDTLRAPHRITVPEGMTAPLGCDAVAVPARLGPLVMPRLPRVGCVYADEAHWWWLVPSDSDYALDWPSPRGTPRVRSCRTPRGSPASSTGRTARSPTRRPSPST